MDIHNKKIQCFVFGESEQYGCYEHPFAVIPVSLMSKLEPQKILNFIKIFVPDRIDSCWIKIMVVGKIQDDTLFRTLRIPFEDTNGFDKGYGGVEVFVSDRHKKFSFPTEERYCISKYIQILHDTAWFSPEAAEILHPTHALSVLLD